MDFLHILLIITVAILLPIALSKRPRQDPDQYHPSPELEARAKARALQIAALPFARRVKSIHDLIITLVREKDEAIKELESK